MPNGLRPWAGDLPRSQAAHDAWIVPRRVGPPTDLHNPCDWQQWAGEGRNRRRPAGWEGDAKLQAIIHAVREGGISCRSKTPTLVEHNSRSEGKLGPKRTVKPRPTAPIPAIHVCCRSGSSRRRRTPRGSCRSPGGPVCGCRWRRQMDIMCANSQICPLFRAGCAGSWSRLDQ